jgi:hypothetical protein
MSSSRYLDHHLAAGVIGWVVGFNDDYPALKIRREIIVSER